MTDIANLEQLLNLKKSDKIIEKKIKCLTAPGENYGSLMLNVFVKISNENGNVKEINIVAKTLPPNPEMQEMFNCPVTFKNEIAIYKSIVPLLRSFVKEKNVKRVVDFAADYYGSRPNLHGRDTNIDKDAALLLENLKIRGFVNLDRTIGFGLDGAKLVLTDLAHLHAITIAFKLDQPVIFEKEIKPYLQSLSVSEELFKDWEDKYLNIIQSVPKLQPHLERLKKISVRIYPPPPPREPWGTFSHNDCWVNNTMVRLQNGTVVENKLVDFQICDYGSPAKDVLFFLFSSVQNDVLEKNYEGLVKFYHSTFVSILEDFNCNLSKFSFDEFSKELDFQAKNTQFIHTTLMLFPIFAPKLDVSCMSEVKPSDIGNMEPTDLHKEKLVFVVEQFIKKNWI